MPPTASAAPAATLEAAATVHSFVAAAPVASRPEREVMAPSYDMAARIVQALAFYDRNDLEELLDKAGDRRTRALLSACYEVAKRQGRR